MLETILHTLTLRARLVVHCGDREVNAPAANLQELSLLRRGTGCGKVKCGDQRHLWFLAALTHRFCYQKRGHCLIENATQGNGPWEGDDEETGYIDLAPGAHGGDQTAISNGRSKRQETDMSAGAKMDHRAPRKRRFVAV
jgi:hypothetical protein